MKDVSILHSRVQFGNLDKLIKRPSKASLKEPEKLTRRSLEVKWSAGPAHTKILISNSIQNHCYKTPHQILLGWGTHRHNFVESQVDWQSNKTILFLLYPKFCLLRFPSTLVDRDCVQHQYDVY